MRGNAALWWRRQIVSGDSLFLCREGSAHEGA